MRSSPAAAVRDLKDEADPAAELELALVGEYEAGPGEACSRRAAIRFIRFSSFFARCDGEALGEVLRHRLEGDAPWAIFARRAKAGGSGGGLFHTGIFGFVGEGAGSAAGMGSFGILSSADSSMVPRASAGA